jgi:hypothetical protein
MPSRETDSTTDPEEEAWVRGKVESRERHDTLSRDAFEARAVGHVLRRCDMSSDAAYLAGAARELTGRPTISFALLRHLVPDFPIRLGVAKLYYLKQNLTLEVLFRRPRQSRVYRAFHEWAEEDADDGDEGRPRGLIFPLTGCPGNGNRAILHTYPVSLDGEQTRITFGVKERREVVFYTLEPLDQLLAALIRTYRHRDENT